jgi:hypothetical protein
MMLSSSTSSTGPLRISKRTKATISRPQRWSRLIAKKNTAGKGPPSRPFITPPPHQDTKSASLARWYIFANGSKSLKILTYLMRIVRGRLTQCAPSILIMILGYALWMILDDRRTLRIGILRGFILFSALFQKSSLRL